jgi:hypothetical protein
MSWSLRYRAGGRARKLVFARYPGLSLPEARKVGAGLYGLVASGRDPGAERKASRRRDALAKAPIRDTIEKVARQCLKHAARRTRASTAAEVSRIFRVYVLPAWKGKRLSEIDKAAVRSLIAGIAARAPVMANRVLTAVKALFNFAVAEDILTASPCAGLRPPAAEVSRDRVALAGLRGTWCVRRLDGQRSEPPAWRYHQAFDSHRPAAQRGRANALVRVGSCRQDLDASARAVQERPRASSAAIRSGDRHPRGAAA